MSGMEVVAVLGCVAAVVSAYQDGGKIVKQIKAKRAAKKALAPTQSLESSLERGPIAVEQAKDNGIERYGSRFATGDREATEALRNIIISLQGTLLRHLWSAQENDNVTDFDKLVDASDFGRIQSVNVLNDLYMRMARAAPLHQNSRLITSALPSQQVASQVFSTGPTLPGRNLPLENPVPKKNPGRLPDSTQRKWGIFPSRRHQNESGIAPESLKPGNINESAPNDSSLGIQSGGSASSTGESSSQMESISSEHPADAAIALSPWRTTSELSTDEENPWREESSTSSQINNLTPIPSPTFSRTRTNQSTVINSGFPYGGYCKGAFKLQVGLDKESVKLRNQSTSMTGQSNYWACASSKCAFEGPARKKGKDWTFDDTIRVHNAVQYRWTFLAKCHVALSKVKNGQHDYQCVFCGVQPSANNVYRGEKAFLEHVSQQHRGQQPDPSILDKICCIHSRVALEEEIFDVNLTPKEESPLVHRQVFAHTPDPITESLDDNAWSNDGVFEWPAIEELPSTSQRE